MNGLNISFPLAGLDLSFRGGNPFAHKKQFDFKSKPIQNPQTTHPKSPQNHPSKNPLKTTQNHPKPPKTPEKEATRNKKPCKNPPNSLGYLMNSLQDLERRRLLPRSSGCLVFLSFFSQGSAFCLRLAFGFLFFAFVFLFLLVPVVFALFFGISSRCPHQLKHAGSVFFEAAPCVVLSKGTPKEHRNPLLEGPQ